jgi:hypothetical protein
LYFSRTLLLSGFDEAHCVDRVVRGREDRKRTEESGAGDPVDCVAELRIGDRAVGSELVEQRLLVEIGQEIVPLEDDPDWLYGRERYDDEAYGRLQEGAESELDSLAAREERGLRPRCGTRRIRAPGAR